DAPFLQDAVQQIEDKGTLEERLWLLGEIARGQAYVDRVTEAKATLAEGRRQAREAARGDLEVVLWSVQVELLWKPGRGCEALTALRESLALQRSRGPLDLFAAGALLNLGTISLARQEDLAGGRAAVEEAVALCERLAPRSAALARALERLAELSRAPKEKQAYLERALAVREQGPESQGTVNLLLELGQLASASDPQRWVALARRAVAVEEHF